MKKILSVLVTAMLMVSLASCGSGSKAGSYKDGNYEGVGKGNGGDIKVSVEVTDGKIKDVKIVDQKETADLFESAKNSIIPEIVKNQGTDGVNTVSGATNSSKGIIEAVNNALSQAK